MRMTGSDARAGARRSHRSLWVSPKKPELWLASAVAAATLGVGFAVTTATTVAASSSPYTIDAVVPLTGPLQAYGLAAKNSLLAAASVVNKAGGLDHHRIVVNVANDSGTPTQAVTLVKGELSSSNKPNYIFGGDSSPESLAILPLTTAARVLTIQQTVTATVVTAHKFPYNFSTAPTTAIGYTTLVKSFTTKGYKKVGILVPATTFGSGQASLAEKGLRKAGIAYKVASFAATTLSVTPQLETLQAYDPTVLYYVGYGPVVGHILTDLHTLGWNVPSVGNPAVAATNLKTLVTATVLSKTVVEAFSVAQYIPPAKRSEALRICLAALKQQGPISLPLYNYTFTYDGIMLLSMAVKQAGSITTSKVVAALEHLKQVTPKPYVSFPKEGYSPTKHLITAGLTAFVFLKEGALVTGTLKPYR
jgi:branched-chain amino acid transport system substrate-binding protein